MIRAGLTAAGVLAASLAIASDTRGPIPGESLRQVISGNTVTGRHDTGMPYSEWHSPDGRVFGHNNHEVVERGCWDIKDDAVCYYYAGGSVKGVFCWTFNKVSETGFRLKSTETGLGAVGLLQAGNPYNHSDGGKPWSCEPLSSQKMTPRPRAIPAGFRP